MEARNIEDWKSALREADAAIANGATPLNWYALLIIFVQNIMPFLWKFSHSQGKRISSAASCLEVGSTSSVAQIRGG